MVYEIIIDRGVENNLGLSLDIFINQERMNIDITNNCLQLLPCFFTELYLKQLKQIPYAKLYRYHGTSK